MRRAFAGVVLGVSLWIGSMAWSGFLMTRTVLDPGRSEAVAEALLRNDAVRDQLVQNIADGLQRTLPEGAPVERPQLEAAARTALDSPAVELLIEDAFVRTHQAFLGEGDAPESLDAGAFGGAARDALVSSRPELDGILPQSPAVEVPLPTERVPNLGPVRRGIETAVPFMAGAAVLGSLFALLVTSNRPAIIRRAGFWALGLSAFVLAFAYGIPWAAREWAPDQAEVVAGLIGALAESTRGPALVLAAAGAGGLVLSLVWKAAPALIPDGDGGAPAPPTRKSPGRFGREVSAPRPPRRDIPQAYRPQQRPSAPPPTAPLPPVHRAPDGPGPDRAPVDDPTRGFGDLGRSVDPTRVEQAASGGVTPGSSAAPESARWVDGHGWVHDGTGEIPPNARWVPGVGYVLDSD